MDTIISVVVAGLVIGMGIMMIRYASFINRGPQQEDRIKNREEDEADHSSNNQKE